jgi:hypothetical protein
MKYKRIVSFGDSFTWGTDLADIGSVAPMRCSNSTWPALLSKHYNLDYWCRAIGGQSNAGILRWLLICLFQKEINPDDLVIVNWTWIDREDFFDSSLQSLDIEQDFDLGWQTVRNDSNTEMSKIYFSHIHSELRSKYETLKNIQLAITLLQAHKVNFLMTCLDSLTIDTEYFAPEYIRILVDQVANKLVSFENRGFYNWATDHGFPVGKTGHPLEEAHQAAFEYIRDNYDFTK